MSEQPFVRPAPPDPREITQDLWLGFTGETGWDVGANCGQCIMTMWQVFNQVVSFEPCEASFRFAKEHFPENLFPPPRLVLKQLALSDYNGSLELAFPAPEQKETGQLVTPYLKGMEWEPEDWETTERVTVPCAMADTLAVELGPPSFMKVDTEGHELAVLLGAIGIINDGKTDFLIEFHSPENQERCCALLRSHRYKVALVRHPYYKVGSPMWHQHGWIRAFGPGTSA